MKRILLLEDDRALNRGISLKLEKEGYEVLSAFSVKEAEEQFQKGKLDLIISDITLPDGNGMDFCREVRKRSDVYIIFLTALDQEVDIVNGYDCGADDYITKPFSLLVLISKVNACMRRTEKQSGQILISKSPEIKICKGFLISGDLEVHCHTMQVYRNRDAIVLSKKEIQLLICLMEHAGTVLTKEQILERVWDKDGQFVDDNTVTVNISRLKNKLDTNAIENIRGLGYIWTGTVTKK